MPSQELLAISNMLNITIRIFSYGIGGDVDRCEWKNISPDPEMAPFSEFAEGTIPHMFLYNSDNTHYDLLVEDNSRLAVLGLISMEDNIMEEKKEMVKKWFKHETKQRRVTKSKLDNDDGSDIHQQNDQHYSIFQTNSTHREGGNLKVAKYPGERVGTGVVIENDCVINERSQAELRMNVSLKNTTRNKIVATDSTPLQELRSARVREKGRVTPT